MIFGVKYNISSQELEETDARELYAEQDGVYIYKTIIHFRSVFLYKKILMKFGPLMALLRLKFKFFRRSFRRSIRSLHLN